jgi:hypothetical protein
MISNNAPIAINKNMLDLIKKILWDYKLSDEEIIQIYSGNLEIGGMNEIKLKARLLNSYNWYTLIKELGFNEAKQLLKPEIIQYLYPKNLRKQYLYAAGLL